MKAGKQTETYYNIDSDLFDKINENKNSFSPQQVDEFLKLFKGEITQNETYKKLSNYNQKRFTLDNDLPQIEDTNGKKSKILNLKYKNIWLFSGQVGADIVDRKFLF